MKCYTKCSVTNSWFCLAVSEFTTGEVTKKSFEYQTRPLCREWVANWQAESQRVDDSVVTYLARLLRAGGRRQGATPVQTKSDANTHAHTCPTSWLNSYLPSKRSNGPPSFLLAKTPTGSLLLIPVKHETQRINDCTFRMFRNYQSELDHILERAVQCQ